MDNKMNTNKGFVAALVGVVVAFSLLAGVIGLGMWGMPKYRIYKQDLRGQATLREQEWEKKVAIEAAKAEKESPVLKAEAEVARAYGVAEANKIIGESLKNNEGYLQYLWITNLQAGDKGERIYIPTEAGLPIIEANR